MSYDYRTPVGQPSNRLINLNPTKTPKQTKTTNRPQLFAEFAGPTVKPEPTVNISADENELVKLIQSACSKNSNAVMDFVHLVKAMQLNGYEVEGIVRSAKRVGVVTNVAENNRVAKTLAQKTDGFGRRRGNLSLAQETVGNRIDPQTKQKYLGATLVLPSLLYQIVELDCLQIEALNRYILDIMGGPIAIIPIATIKEYLGPDVKQQDDINTMILAFVKARPDCNPNRQDIMQFLRLVNHQGMKAKDIKGIISILKHKGLLPGKSGYFTGKRDEEQVFIGQRKSTLEKLRGQFPESLEYKERVKGDSFTIRSKFIWNVLLYYCDNIQAINNAIYAEIMYKKNLATIRA